MTTVVQINPRGTLTLPKAMRNAAGIEAGQQVIAEVTSEGLLLRPAVTLPIETYSDERVREFAKSEKELKGYRFK